LRQRLANSKNFLLILGETTKWDVDWIPFEIQTAIDDYALPVIIAYTAYSAIPPNSSIQELRAWWPSALGQRIDIKAASTIHIPFRQRPIHDALNRYDVDAQPRWPITFYTREKYQEWSLLAKE
jgi:hypothetical protein